ncbi:serine hydrolase domain-containing protein [Rufibacter radiotolerans]|uniref:serine hydrolase domain-containing protein n=1 Tax=Rufibacter radiotolerans TaxID=1379910 RepID=UPI000664751E|nr:serine hydrolase domain-containing protein [Rufibacter radiotolerans]
MNRLLFLLSIAFLLPFWIKAQELNKKKLDSLLMVLVDQKKIMGSVSIFQDGKETYRYATGFSNIAQKTPITQTTKYRIGSVSKMLTATVIMQLLEKGQLTADTKLARFYPDLPNAQQITILHLLQHKSGLKNILHDTAYLKWRQHPIARQEMLGKIKNLGTKFNAGEKQEYSNTNYILLTFIAEDLEKKPFSKILEDRISKPLRLKNTFFGTPIQKENGEALSYHKREDWLLFDETHFSVAAGAGSIVSTPKDLNLFLTALFNGKLVFDKSLQAMQQLQGEYGIGLKKLKVQGVELIGHSGGIDGFKSVAFYAPAQKMSFALSVNAADLSLTELLWGISSIALNKDYDLPNFNSRKIHSLDEIETLTGAYADKDASLKVKLTAENGILLLENGGQKTIPLDAINKNKFRMGLGETTFRFIPSEKKLLITFEGGKSQELTKL